jgi:hypothetical protein
MQYMIDQNLHLGWFQFAAQVVLRGPAAIRQTRMVVMGLHINIDTYNP